MFSTDRIHIVQERTGLIRLSMAYVEESDIGTYRLRVWNKHGEASCEARLVYDGLEVQPGQTLGSLLSLLDPTSPPTTWSRWLSTLTVTGRRCTTRSEASPATSTAWFPSETTDSVSPCATASVSATPLPTVWPTGPTSPPPPTQTTCSCHPVLLST